MRLQPKLVMQTMIMACWNGKGVQYTPIEVEAWDNIGLCIHMEKDGYRVSHMQSGRAILRHIDKREEAIQFMVYLKESTNVEWNYPFDILINIITYVMKEQIVAIQQEIDYIREKMEIKNAKNKEKEKNM